MESTRVYQELYIDDKVSMFAFGTRVVNITEQSAVAFIQKFCKYCLGATEYLFVYNKNVLKHLN